MDDLYNLVVDCAIRTPTGNTAIPGSGGLALEAGTSVTSKECSGVSICPLQGDYEFLFIEHHEASGHEPLPLIPWHRHQGVQVET
jgi:hypothetical protein